MQTVRGLITVDLAIGADFLGPTPLLIVHGTFCSPDGARAVFERATGPTEILWLETTNHIDLYDPSTSTRRPNAQPSSSRHV